MRRLIGLCAMTAAKFVAGGDYPNVENSGGGRPPGPPFPPPESDGRTWRDVPGRPSEFRPSNRSPSIAVSRLASFPSNQVSPPVTVPQPGFQSISTIYLTSIVSWIEVVTHTLQPAPNATVTIEQTRTVPSTVYQPHTTTEIPPAVCHDSGAVPTPNAAVCNGKDCGITFEKGAIIHWELLTNRTPLVTHYLHSTCVAVVCNTTEFSLYYSRTATSCDRPPCPSNSLNCECNIVIGPIRLPDGRFTSVTQTGPSGWNLNLGPTATANNIGRCGSNGSECGTVTTTLFTPLVYTDEVEVLSTAIYGNDTIGAEATAFILPKLTDYFPPNDLLGMCTNVKLSLPPITSTIRKRDDVATVGGDGITTWPGCETLTDANAKRGLEVRQTLSSESTQLPICSSEEERRTTTLTVTPGASTPVETQARSGAVGEGIGYGWIVWLVPAILMMGSMGLI